MKAEKLNWLIPCSFSTQVIDRTRADGKIEEISVKVGSRKDEMDGSKGASATQQTTVYPVTIGSSTIRLFDTPGIGDTRGIDHDRQNMCGHLVYPQLLRRTSWSFDLGEREFSAIDCSVSCYLSFRCPDSF